MYRGRRQLLRAAMLFCAAVMVALGGGRARAAEIAIRLTDTGIDAEARQRFQDSLGRAFAGVRHEVVPEEKASHRLEANIKKTSSIYFYRVRIVDLKSGGAIGEASDRCGPCSLDEAASRIKLAVESLAEKAFEQPAVRAAPNAAATGAAAPKPGEVDQAASKAAVDGPPPKPKTALPAAPEATPPTTPRRTFRPEHPEQQEPLSPPLTLSPWMRVLQWSGIASLGGATVLLHAQHWCTRSGDGSNLNACSGGMIALSTVAIFAAVWGAEDSVLSFAFRPTPEAYADGLSWRIWPWAVLVAGLASGASGVELLREDGYGKQSYKIVGGVAIGLGAIAAVTSIGAIATYPRPGRAAREESLALHVSPAGLGLSGSF